MGIKLWALFRRDLRWVRYTTLSDWFIRLLTHDTVVFETELVGIAGVPKDEL